MDVFALDEAPKVLAGFDERKCQVVELHYFGGLTYDETAEALGLSAATCIEFAVECRYRREGRVPES